MSQRALPQARVTGPLMVQRWYTVCDAVPTLIWVCVGVLCFLENLKQTRHIEPVLGWFGPSSAMARAVIAPTPDWSPESIIMSTVYIPASEHVIRQACTDAHFDRRQKKATCQIGLPGRCWVIPCCSFDTPPTRPMILCFTVDW